MILELPKTKTMSRQSSVRIHS